LFVKNGHHIRACRACGTWFVADPPGADALRAIYGHAYFTERLAQHDTDSLAAVAWCAAVANARRRLRRIRRDAPEARRLLDVGCGTGAFLSVARHAYACCGVDVSAEAVAVVREDLDVDVLAGDLATVDLPAGSFDVVTLFDAIEHVPDPHGVLVAARRLLSPRGILIVTTGDTDSLICRLTGKRWHLMTPPEHLTFFSKTGLARLVTRCGMTVRSVAHEPVTANVGYMARKLAAVVGRPLGWLPWFAATSGLARLDVDVNLLDVVTLVAHRAEADPLTGSKQTDG
jgi:SAM-dependent methyltransferase